MKEYFYSFIISTLSGLFVLYIDKKYFKNNSSNQVNKMNSYIQHLKYDKPELLTNFNLTLFFTSFFISILITFMINATKENFIFLQLVSQYSILSIIFAALKQKEDHDLISVLDYVDFILDTFFAIMPFVFAALVFVSISMFIIIMTDIYNDWYVYIIMFLANIVFYYLLFIKNIFGIK